MRSDFAKFRLGITRLHLGPRSTKRSIGTVPTHSFQRHVPANVPRYIFERVAAVTRKLFPNFKQYPRIGGPHLHLFISEIVRKRIDAYRPQADFCVSDMNLGSTINFAFGCRNQRSVLDTVRPYVPASSMARHGWINTLVFRYLAWVRCSFGGTGTTVP